MTGGKVVGDGSIRIVGVASLDNPKPGHIVPVLEDRALKSWKPVQIPSALIVKEETVESNLPKLVHGNPRLALAIALKYFHPEPAIEPGIHHSAIVADSAIVDPSAQIGPHVVIENGVSVGGGVSIGAGCYIGENSIIGEDTKLYPNVTILHDIKIGPRCIIHPGAVVGSDGFGFTPSKDGIVKIPQVGTVEIGDDVEIGANTTIDRATLDATIIADDAKLDNLIQVAHNVRIGRHTMIAAQTGIPGRVNIGENVVVAGQAGFLNGIKVGDGSIIAGQSGVIKSLPPGSRVSGYPARDHHQALRLQALMNRLPEIFERLEKLEKKKEKG